MWHSIAQSGMLEVTLMDLSTTVPVGMGAIESTSFKSEIRSSSNNASQYIKRYPHASASSSISVLHAEEFDTSPVNVPKRDRGPLSASFCALRLRTGDFMSLMAYDILYSGVQRLSPGEKDLANSAYATPPPVRSIHPCKH